MARKTMTAQHKQALAQGRQQGRAVRAYLEALEQNRPKRGRKRSADSIKKQLDAANTEYETASPVRALELAQKRIDLEAELATLEGGNDLEALERDFIKVAKAYSESKRITRKAFREIGVPPAVLDKAGIK